MGLKALPPESKPSSCQALLLRMEAIRWSRDPEACYFGPSETKMGLNSGAGLGYALASIRG